MPSHDSGDNPVGRAYQCLLVPHQIDENSIRLHESLTLREVVVSNEAVASIAKWDRLFKSMIRGMRKPH